MRPTAPLPAPRPHARRLRLALALAGLLLASAASADPLSKVVEIDFYRDAPSRSLKGLATRSDGRIVAGPVFTDLPGPAPADLLWCLVPGDAGRWFVGSGPDGRIFEATLEAAPLRVTTREVVKLDDSHVFSLLRLADGRLLAGSSPSGSVSLIADGRVVARVRLPVDTVLDFLDTGSEGVLVATGNPGRIYRLDLARFAGSGVATEKAASAEALGAQGVSLFGEVRDRNLRRLAALPDGRVLAGSAPRGNLYAFPATGGAPVVLVENRDAEVTDLLVTSQGDVFASLVFSTGSGTARINRPAVAPTPGAPEPSPAAEPPAAERFSGRGALVWIPAEGGFPETLASRAGMAFYRVLQRGPQLIIAGGEQGELLGYDVRERRSLTLPGSASAQLNGLVPVDDSRYLALRNNAPGFALVDFSAAGNRELETRRLDIGLAARLGAFRFGRLRDLAEGDVGLELRTNFGSDELEGWSAWTPASPVDGAWATAAPLRGRYLKLRLTLPASAPASLQLDKAQLFYLGQNRRPTLADFRLFSPNFALLPGPQPAPVASTTLAQALGQTKDTSDDKRRSALLASPIVPSPGNQVAYWSVTDPDGDTLTATFSLRRDGEEAWTDLAVATEQPFVQFDTSALPDGLYFTRLIVAEGSPRPEAERLTTRFETDDLLIDRTPPEIEDASAVARGSVVVVSIRGRDALSLLEGAEFRFNHGLVESVEQPADGIRDGRSETFVLELPSSRLTRASSVEVVLFDAFGNRSSRRIALP